MVVGTSPCVNDTGFVTVTVHTALEEYMKSNIMQGTMSERESSALVALVEAGTLTQAQVDEFNVVHTALSTGGFMP